MPEQIFGRRNIGKVLVLVEMNKGAAGIDDMQWSELLCNWNGENIAATSGQ